MAIKKKPIVVKEDADMAGANMDSVMAKQPVDSKLDMITNTVSAMSKMSGEDLNKLMQALAQIGHEADGIPDGNAAQNMASIQTHMKEAIAEEVNALFDGSTELTESFKEKAVTLFEAALSARASVNKAELKEELELEYNERLSEEVARIEEAADKYFTHIAEEWLSENRLTIESSLKEEAADELFEDLKAVITKHNIVFPEGQDNIVEQLVTKVEELTSRLDEREIVIIELKDQLIEDVKSRIFEDVTLDLTDTDKAKFETLIEDVNFDPDTYDKKLQTIKDQYFTVVPAVAAKKAGSEYLARKMTQFNEEVIDTNTLEKIDTDEKPKLSQVATTTAALFNRRY